MNDMGMKLAESKSSTKAYWKVLQKLLKVDLLIIIIKRKK